MTNRILVIGSSHAATLYLASEVFLKIAPVTVDWMVTPANLEFLVDYASGRISPPKKYLDHHMSRNMRVLGGRDTGAHLGDYDCLIYSAIGLRPVGVLETHPALFMKTAPVSDSLLEAMIAAHPITELHNRNLTEIRANFSNAILCEPWIRPLKLPSGLERRHWERFCLLEDRCLESITSGAASSLVPRLPGNEILTQPELVSDANHPATHGNKEYAEHMVNTLVDFL